jgi:N-acetylneuraminic acid mutarotase
MTGLLAGSNDLQSFHISRRAFIKLATLASLMAGCSPLAAASPVASENPTATFPPTPKDTSTPDPARLNGQWQSRPPMLHARAAHAVVSTEASIYALAGTGSGGGPVLEVERFDGGQWTLETSLPGNGLNAPAAVVLNGKIYLMGGFSASTNFPTDNVMVYDPAGKSWDTAPRLPAPRGGHAAVVLDEKIHVVGGGNSRSTIADHSVFDPGSDTWGNLAPLPRSEGSPALVEFAGKLYALGGRSGSSDFGDVYIYDPASDVWSSGTAIEPRGTAGAVVYCGTIYLFGGESQARHKSLADVLRYDGENDAWVAASPMPTARNFARAVLYDQEVYVVGGSSQAGSSHSSAGSAVVESFHADCEP